MYLHTDNESEPMEIQLDWKNRKKDGLLKVKHGDKNFKLHSAEILALGMVIAKPDIQEKLVPVHTITSRMIEKAVQIEATKDIKKGDKITAMLKFYIPDEALRSMLEIPEPSQVQIK